MKILCGSFVAKLIAILLLCILVLIFFAGCGCVWLPGRCFALCDSQQDGCANARFRLRHGEQLHRTGQDRTSLEKSV